MRGKRTCKFIALLVTLALSVMLMAPCVFATDNYAEVAGTSTTFKKYLVLPKNVAVPNLTFNFTIASGAAVTGDASNLPIYRGDDADRVDGVPTIAADQAAFTTADSTTNGAADDKITNDAEKKYAEKDVTIDFSGVKFKEPGIYRYIITEDRSAPAGVSFDGEPKRTLDVNVVDDNGALKVESYVMYYGEISSAQNKTTVKEETDRKYAGDATITAGDKCSSYINQYPSHNLYIGKKISGNQASKDKYFRFTVTLSNAGNASLIHVGGDYNDNDALNSDVNAATTVLDTDIPEGETGYTNPSSFTTEADGSKVVVFYLQGDQYVNLMGLKEDAVFEIAEDDYSADGYVSTATSATDTFTIGTLVFNNGVTGTISDTDIYAGFLNTKQGTIPTGVILAASGLLISGAVVVGGIIFFGRRSKKKYEDE